MASVLLAYFPLHVQQLTHFQTQVVHILVLDEGTYPFPMVPHLRRRFVTSRFFLVIFNYCGHSPMIGWPTTSALAWVTERSTDLSHRLCVWFFIFLFLFLLSLLPQEFASHSLHNLDLPYHVTNGNIFHLGFTEINFHSIKLPERFGCKFRFQGSETSFTWV